MLVHTIETIADPSLLCGATFKVWIVSTIDCRVQGNIFSFCRHIYISTSTSLSIADIQSAHWSITSKFEMPSAVVSAVLCHALLTTWQEYGSHGSGWLLDYSFSGKDFDRMLLAVDSSLHTEAQWESALHSAFVVYAGKIPFYWEQEGLFEFFLHCFSPMKTKNVVEPDMLKLSISRWKQVIQNNIQNDNFCSTFKDELSAGSIGLSGAEQCKTTTNTFQFLHCLRQISASTTVCSWLKVSLTNSIRCSGTIRDSDYEQLCGTLRYFNFNLANTHRIHSVSCHIRMCSKILYVVV